MKTEEDEAFDELAKRQGAWGGGYQAKRKMAADKYSDIVSDGGLDPRNKMDAQPAQEQWNEDEWRRNNWRCGHGWLRGEQCEICNATQEQRPWVGLTDEEIREIHSASRGQDIGVATGLIEAKLKEKNNGT